MSKNELSNNELSNVDSYGTLQIFYFHFGPLGNYGYLLHDSESDRTVSIDAGDHTALDNALRSKGWHLDEIWVTHHDHDHTAAIGSLRSRYDCKVCVPALEAEFIAGATDRLCEGDSVAIGRHNFSIIALPGHTDGQIGYYNSALGLLFAGDALFVLGCGRIIAGRALQMWQSLEKLRRLDDDVLLYCGHEYSLQNAGFALGVDPHNDELRAYAAEIRTLRSENRACIPARLGREKRCNPFLRPDDIDIQRGLRLEGSALHEVFAALRSAKDNYRG